MIGKWEFHWFSLIRKCANIKKSYNGAVFTGHHACRECEVVTAQCQVMYWEFQSNIQAVDWLNNFIGIISRSVLDKKTFSRKNMQATGATSKEHTILIGYGKHTRARLGQLFRRVKDPYFLQCSKLKVLHLPLRDYGIHIVSHPAAFKVTK